MDRWIPYCVTVPRWSRRCLLLLIVVIIFLVIISSSYFRPIFSNQVEIEGITCDVSSSILKLYEEADISNARIDVSNRRTFGLFVGNGYIGLPLNGDFSMYIKSGRTLSLHVPYYPSVKVRQFPVTYTEQTALHYTHGIAYVDRCYRNKIRITYSYFAHRTIPSIFVQEISIQNAFSQSFFLDLEQKGSVLWDSAVKRTVKLLDSDRGEEVEFAVTTGKVLDSTSDKIYIVSIVTNSISTQIEVPGNDALVLKIFTSVVYTQINRNQFNEVKADSEKKAISSMKLAVGRPYEYLKRNHVDVWNKLWNTGFSISYSKAKGALNGDTVNATIYYLLSSVRALYHEETTTAETRAFVTNSLSYVEGCYGSNHHTLEADNLWKSFESIEDINSIVSLWLLTLEKQGCYNLVKAGADGVMQAMVLSFGSFRFNKQHLEFNMHPSFLHRTYHFRRINYGNQTHVNVTVEVDDSNRAMLFVALDRSDKTYYACDGGCLDKPIKLGSETIQFPVKLTKPFTAILYITFDKQHMEELRHTLHVKDVVEAPAQEHAMLILHKHGHNLGGLPTFFWVSIFTLIVIFHLFLFKLIYNEYWNQNTSIKYRQNCTHQQLNGWMEEEPALKMITLRKMHLKFQLTIFLCSNCLLTSGRKITCIDLIRNIDFYNESSILMRVAFGFMFPYLVLKYTSQQLKIPKISIKK